MIRPLIILAPLALTGCMAAAPARPVLTCTNCGDLTYYGPQQPDPRVEMARVLTGGLSSVVGIAVGGDVLKSLGRASGATSTLERSATTTNTTTNVTDRDHSSTLRESTSVTDTATNTNQQTTTNNTTTTDTGAAP